MRYAIVIFFLLVLVKMLSWSVIVPIWQTPDEQAHFAQLQWYAEKKTLVMPEINLSEEIAKSEEVLGTFRDKFGNNKYTYHPEYKNPIVGSLYDRNRPEFNLPESLRTNYVRQEAAAYPPLYYLTAVPFYNLVYHSSLIDRVYVSRFVSLIYYLLLIICAYKIGRVVWEDKFRAWVLTIFVAFHPMLSFVAAGFHPDNLLNLLYSVGILFCLLILKNGVKFKYLIALAIVCYLGINTKPLMFLLFPVIAAVIIKKPILKTLILLSPVAVFAFQIKLPFVPYVTPNSPLYSMNLVDYLHFRIPKMFFEVWPWYWGVFKWLSLTLPPLVLKIITRVAAISVVGLIFTKKTKFESKALVFFIVSSVSYIVYLLLWDFRLMQSAGFSAGIQGRYFFPNIVAHMVIFIFGLSWGRFSKPVLIIVSALMIALNIFAFRYLYLSYN